MASESGASRFLSADDIWAADDIREGEVEVPEWGGKVHIRGLTLQQMAALANQASKTLPNGQANVDRELSVALTLIYGMVEPRLALNDVPRLREKSAAAVTRIVQAINALGPTEEAVDAALKSDAGQLNGAVSVFPGARAGDDASAAS
jgi:hypothetical protein